MLDDNRDRPLARERTARRAVATRLRRAAPILVGVCALVAVLVVAGAIALPAAALVIAVLVATAVLPLGGRTTRLADRRRQMGELAWHRAIELPLEAMDEPAYILRADGTVKFENSAAAQAFGPAAQDAHLSVRIRSPAILGIVQQATETGRPASVEHGERVPAERWYQVRCAPLDGTPTLDRRGRLYLLTFRDMTEARRMDRMRTDFVANASHELRTPLASLTGFIETIKGPAARDAAARERFLDIMLDQATRMTRLVEDLMSLSRLELKAHLPPTEQVDLVRLLGHVADTLSPLAAELKVDLQRVLPDEPVFIRGDRDELVQVFENLIENACKYGQSGGVVTLSLAPVDGGGAGGPETVEVTIRDRGPGISPEHVPRLTERFYRVDVDASRSKKGTGLGLAIVKHILMRHRTRLVVRSTLGEGSAFSVAFARLSNGECRVET